MIIQKKYILELHLSKVGMIMTHIDKNNCPDCGSEDRTEDKTTGDVICTNCGGILDKVIDGKKTKLSITILEPNKEFVKYLTMYKEDAKKAGVEINVKLIEWNAFLKLLDERKFQAVRLGWGAGSVDWDPKQIWHSESQKGGSNFIGYKNPEVDKLIDEARTILDFEKRQKVLRKVFKLIADDVPYASPRTGRPDLYRGPAPLLSREPLPERGLPAASGSLRGRLRPLTGRFFSSMGEQNRRPPAGHGSASAGTR